MPLLIKFTKFEQSHDGYCSDNEDFVNRIVTLNKKINILNKTEFEKYKVADGSKLKLSHPFIKMNYKGIISLLERCEYGSGYFDPNNVVIDILKITVSDEYEQPNNNELTIHQTYNCAGYRRKIRRIKYDLTDSESESESDGKNEK